MINEVFFAVRFKLCSSRSYVFVRQILNSFGQMLGVSPTQTQNNGAFKQRTNTVYVMVFIVSLRGLLLVQKKNWSRSFFPRQSELTGKMTLAKLIIQNSLRFTICFFSFIFCFNVHICVIHCLCVSFHCFFPIRFLSIGKLLIRNFFLYTLIQNNRVSLLWVVQSKDKILSKIRHKAVF